MTATRSNISADQILQAHDQALALPVILSGVLDEKIAELKVEQAKLAEAQGIVATLAEAKKVRDAAQAIQGQAQREYAASQVTATEIERSANAKFEAAVAREQATNRAREELAESVVKFNARTTSIENSHTLNGQQLNSLAAELAARTKDLDAREAKIKTDRADLNRRLDALKVAV